MEKILTIECSPLQRDLLEKAAGNYFHIEHTTINDLNMELMSASDLCCLLIIVPIDLFLQKQAFLSERISAFSCFNIIPLLVVSSPDHPDLDEAISLGAYDYLDLAGSPVLILSRIRNLYTSMKHVDPRQEILNSFIFNKCIGAAMLLTFDQKTIRPIMINDEFYQLMGFDKDAFLKYQNDLMESVLPNESELVQETICKASETGTAQCILSNLPTARRFQITYKRIGTVQKEILFLTLVDDVTEKVHSGIVSEALLSLPGMIIYDYDVKTDCTNFYITKKDGSSMTKTILHSSSEEENYSWISPESCRIFRETFRASLARPTSGSFELLASLTHNSYSWHRMYYRSIPDVNGNVFRIVGRIDDLESSAWPGVKDEQSGICDAETHLLTYRAASAFIDQIMTQNKEGILMLIDITGLKQLCSEMSDVYRQLYVRELIRQLKDLFIQTDVMGRFGEEGLIVFLPETISRKIASQRASSVIEAVFQQFQGDACTCSIGISLVTAEHSCAAAAINEANIALWKARSQGPNHYVIYDASQSSNSADIS